MLVVIVCVYLWQEPTVSHPTRREEVQAGGPLGGAQDGGCLPQAVGDVCVGVQAEHLGSIDLRTKIFLGPWGAPIPQSMPKLKTSQQNIKILNLKFDKKALLNLSHNLDLYGTWD